MLRNITRICRYAINQSEKEILKERIANDPKKTFGKWRLVNSATSMDNFSKNQRSRKYLEKSEVIDCLILGGNSNYENSL